VTDGAAAVILAAGDTAGELCERPAWIRAIEHRMECHAPGARDLARSRSLQSAAQAAGVHDRKVDFAELHAPFTFQEVIARDALQLEAGVNVNPSGGALAANPVMAAGLIRVGEVAARIFKGQGDRAVATATQGPCLQQNLVCVLEGA
jgi:acetyl-CoA acetyltransferase